MLRAQLYEMSTFKLQKVLFEMLESENEEINSIDHQVWFWPAWENLISFSLVLTSFLIQRFMSAFYLDSFCSLLNWSDWTISFVVILSF